MRYVIREKFFRLGEDSTITDEFGRPVIEVDGKVFSIHHTLVLRELVALSPTYHVTRNGQEIAAIRKKIFSPFVDRYSVDIAGSEELHVTGSIFEHDYTIRRGNQVVATVSKAWISLTETYGVDIAPGEDDLLILATVLALDLREDEERKD